MLKLILRKIEHFLLSHRNSKWFYISLFVLVVILTTIRQSIITNYGCELCSDKAGYYSYLPAVFHYGFQASDYPVGFDQLHGYGFHQDKEQNKLVIKFTCGVAILLSPFYALAAIISKIFSLSVLPYSYFYLFFINIGAAFYVVLGLHYLRKWLNYYVDEISSFWTILIVFFGTNLYYYTLDESLMSHLYSFSMFSVLLYGFKTFFETKKYNYFLLAIIPLSIAILIRPTNILFLPFAFFISVNGKLDIKTKTLILLSPKYLLSSLAIFVVIISPQLAYWNFAYGSLAPWTYSAGFTLWKHPALLETWLSPQSGLFPYTPIILLSLIFAIVMIMERDYKGWLVITVFVVTSYMCASWYNPFFGECNFGKRPIVEYLPILMLPIGYMLVYYRLYKRQLKYVILISTLFLVYYNQALFGAFNTCFNGDIWEWSKFGLLLKRAFLVIR